MKDKEAKLILNEGIRYYIHERATVGTHWDEWRAVEHVLKKWERSEAQLRMARAGLRKILTYDDGTTTITDIADKLIHHLLQKMRAL